jgi:DNA-binding NtrC family response regulator
MASSRTPGRDADATHSGPGKHVVLILSTDAVAGALLGALIETLGYLVRFYHPPELPDDAMRRTKPSVALVDCADPTLMNDEVLGRARMRGISVLIFGSPDALRRVRQIAHEHALGELVMPASPEMMDEALQRAVKNAC